MSEKERYESYEGELKAAKLFDGGVGSVKEDLGETRECQRWTNVGRG